MAKKDKTIPVTIDDVTVGDKTVSQITVNKQVIGQIEEQEADKKYLATLNDGQKFIAKSQEAALQAVLADYNLHG